MPLVTVTLPMNNHHDLRIFSEAEIGNLGRDLQQFVAETLTCDEPAGKLTPEEVEVKLERGTHKLRSEQEIRILVQASEFPSRKENIQERTEALARKVMERPWARPVTGYVYIRLAPAGYAEF